MDIDIPIFIPRTTVYIFLMSKLVSYSGGKY